MRKYLAVFLGVLFILSLAVTAFAEEKTEITLGGKLILRGWYFDNIDGIVPAKTNSQALYTTNAYITVDAKVSDNVRGFIELETAGGGNRYSGVYFWGNYDSKPNADMWLRQAWIQYTGSGLLGVPAGLKAGHVLFSLGEKIFFDNTRFGDDAIMLWVDPTKELHIAAATAKIVEGPTSLGSINHTADVDAYMLIGTYMLDKDNTLGLNYTLVHSDGNVPSQGADIPNCDSLNFQNVGLHANGKVSGLSYGAEVDFQFGKAKNVYSLDDDAKFSGYGIFAKLGYMLDPVNLRASFAYGSGDNKLDNKIKEFQTLVGSDSIGAIARFTHYTLIYERMVETAAAEQLVTTSTNASPAGINGNIRTTGIANTTYYNLGLDVNPLKELSLSLDGFLLYASKTGAIEEAIGNSVSDKLGWEIDTKISYKIAKNLTYFIEAGLFKPGAFYEDTGLVEKKKTVTTAIHGLSLSF